MSPDEIFRFRLFVASLCSEFPCGLISAHDVAVSTKHLSRLDCPKAIAAALVAAAA